jgi:hypothetical protein
MNERDSNLGSRLSPDEQENTLENIKNNSKLFYERIIKCYSNFHFFMETKYGYDRKDAINEIDKELIFYETNKISRKETWLNQCNYSFVISPHGNGLDCHRTWEALCLGSIPIVKKSNISDLFDDLPVLIIDNWFDIKEDLLIKTIHDFKNKQFNYDKLLLKYWIDKMKDMNKNIRLNSSLLSNENNNYIKFKCNEDYPLFSRVKEEKYTFFHGVDHIGDDMDFKPNITLENLKQYCDNNEKIVAFNTLGFIKNKVDVENLKKTEWINKNTSHGIYIKNKYLLRKE